MRKHRLRPRHVFWRDRAKKKDLLVSFYPIVDGKERVNILVQINGPGKTADWVLVWPGDSRSYYKELRKHWGKHLTLPLKGKIVSGRYKRYVEGETDWIKIATKAFMDVLKQASMEDSVIVA